MTAQFTFLSGARTGQVETFRKAYIGLGRHPLSDLRFDADRDLDVSSRHAVIVRQGEGFTVRDLGSKNGTFVNGQRISSEVTLEDGDVIGYLKRAFQLDDETAQELVAEAAEVREKTIDHFALTNFIRRNSTLQDRIEIVKTMWRVVYADGRLTDYENYLVRKLADLLGLEHHVMIDAKVAVLDERGR